MQALLAAIATAGHPRDAQRLFHGRGSLHPGCEAWTLDAYPPVYLLTKFGMATHDEVSCLQAALRARQDRLAPGEPLNLVLQERSEGRSQTRVLAGSVPEPHAVTEEGAHFQVHLLRGQNHGLFLDMAEGRRWVRTHARGTRVLNLFAYTCAFSVVALQGGAREVVNLDMAQGALAIGRHNHRLNGLAAGARFLAHDLFKSWGKLTRLGPYDLVIADPPSHQKGSFVAPKDYARLLRRLPALVKPGGHALLCLNAPEMSESALRALLASQAPSLEVLQRLPNPAAFADVSPDRALKVLVAQRPPDASPPTPKA